MKITFIWVKVYLKMIKINFWWYLMKKSTWFLLPRCLIPFARGFLKMLKKEGSRKIFQSITLEAYYSMFSCSCILLLVYLVSKCGESHKKNKLGIYLINLKKVTSNCNKLGPYAKLMKIIESWNENKYQIIEKWTILTWLTLVSYSMGYRLWNISIRW